VPLRFWLIERVGWGPYLRVIYRVGAFDAYSFLGNN